MSTVQCERLTGRWFASASSLWLLLLILFVVAGASQFGAAQTCSSGILPSGNGGPIVIQNGTCFVDSSNSPYNYSSVNVIGGGTLCFRDNGDGKNVDFWANGILAESNGHIITSSDAQCGTVSTFGAKGATLTIHLYGKDQGTGKNGSGPGQGILCKTDAHCGVPDLLWNSNSMSTMSPTQCTHAKAVKGYDKNLPGNVDDCFYPYEALIYDNGGTQVGYFGYKMLGVSYNGSLQLLGMKGLSTGTLKPSDTGKSWARLTVDASADTLTLDRDVKDSWTPGDQIVVTTTDYLPAHSEQMTIKSIDNNGDGVSVITLTQKLTYAHNGTTFDLSSIPNDSKGGTIGPEQDPSIKCSGSQTRCVETRAAVGLLTRSVRIISEGDDYNSHLGDTSYFGGHTIARQGFAAFQMQGVEFYQLGQGGRIMHYPVHFHMARKTPQPAGDFAGTFIADCSVWDSMTRWITLHATQGVLLARNVGYKSIGHGYYLEDGSEAGNQLYANLGVLARAAVQNGADQKLNPRNVPGILSSAHHNGGDDEVPFHTDADHPSVFWITNGWNDFEYNMAAGATACGMCYWAPPTMISGSSRNESWSSYAGEQEFRQKTLVHPACGIPENQKRIVDDDTQAGISPVKDFVGNSCVAAQNSFITVGNTSPCYGVTDPGDSTYPRMNPIPNPLAPDFPAVLGCDEFTPAADMYYPKVSQAKGRTPTQCPDGDTYCGKTISCAWGQDGNCMITSLDHYTSSFTWADTNIASMWLRPQWYLITNSAITDAQNGGLTFVSGGGYTGSDEITGYWVLAHRNAFIGTTQKDNPYTFNAGPFHPAVDGGIAAGLSCDKPLNSKYCMDRNEGIIMPLSNFANNQRLFNIYDGPAYQSANAYLDVTTTTLAGCAQDANGQACQNKGWMYGAVPGSLLDPKKDNQCYLPNAAIGWKQPNGFYYPPAFHSDKLYFKDVDIRHFVIEPLFSPGTLNTNPELIKQRYCITSTTFTPGFTDIDRQTELSDDDGSLTGMTVKDTQEPTISVNKDPFFKAPTETAECASDITDNMPKPWGPCTGSGSEDDPLCATANTSPYHYVTSVVYPCLPDGNCGASCPGGNGNLCWFNTCENQQCYGVPLYRLDKNLNETGPVPIRMMGQSTSQRSTLTLDHATYYMDTTVSTATQVKNIPYDKPEQKFLNVFLQGKTYGVFLLYAKPTTKQTYKMYIGSSLDASSLQWATVNQRVNPPQFATIGQIPCDADCYDSTTGILTITIDATNSVFDFQTNYDGAAEEHCAPKNFCSWSGSSCGCNPNQHSVSPEECQTVCSEWATRDVNCPKGGCIGFEFKLTDFTANDQKPTKPFTCFDPSKDSYWDTAFAQGTEDPGACKYTDIPGRSPLCTSSFGAEINPTGRQR